VYVRIIILKFTIKKWDSQRKEKQVKFLKHISMKKLVILLAISAAALSLSAQDLIITANGDTIQCQIIRIDSSSVEYQVVKNGIRERNTMPRRYVADFRVAEPGSPAPVTQSTPKTSSFRWSFSLGYAHRLGEDQSSGSASYDRLFKKMKSCFSWETEIQHYFNRGNGIALNISGVHSSVIERNVYIPQVGQFSKCELKHHVIFVGPAWATRYEADRFLWSGNIALGPLFYSETLIPDNTPLKATATAFGMSYGIGGEYKASPEWAVGMKMGFTVGSASNFKVAGKTVKADEPVSLSSFFITTYFSFRSK